MNITLKLFTALLLFLVNTYTATAEVKKNKETVKIYDVEIIIFEDARARYINSESWPNIITEEVALEKLEPYDETKDIIIVEPLPDEPVILNEELIDEINTFELIKPNTLTDEAKDIIIVEPLPAEPVILNEELIDEINPCDLIKPSTPTNETKDIIIVEPLLSEPEILNEKLIDEINFCELIKPSILTEEYKKISDTSQYNVLQYSAWRQIGLDKSEAFDIDLEQLENHHEKITDNAISGSIKVELARYLHAYSTFEYTRKNNQLNNNVITDVIIDESNANLVLSDDTTLITDTYPINSHRRMRSKELHYIDHPLIGILIQINPVEITQ